MVHDTAVRIMQYRDARPVGEQDNTVLFVCLFVFWSCKVPLDLMPSTSLPLPQETTRGSLHSVVLQLRFTNKDIRCLLMMMMMMMMMMIMITERVNHGVLLLLGGCFAT